MKTFGRYLLYRLENSALRTVIFTIISVIITQNTISDCIDHGAVEYNSTGLYVLATILGTICTLIPILETMCFKNRRNLDTLYFFPIKRWKMATVHFLSGFIQILFIFNSFYFVIYKIFFSFFRTNNFLFNIFIRSYTIYYCINCYSIVRNDNSCS